MNGIRFLHQRIIVSALSSSQCSNRTHQMSNDTCILVCTNVILVRNNVTIDGTILSEYNT